MSVGVILTVLFILLKVFDKITWSWGLVFLPLIVELVFDGLMMAIFIAGGAKASKRFRR